MAADGSARVVLIAFAGNALIAVSKLVASAINEIPTMHMGPKGLFCALSVDFRDAARPIDVEASISDLERAIKAQFPEVKRVFIEAQSVFGHMRALAAAAGGAAPAGGAD